MNPSRRLLLKGALAAGPALPGGRLLAQSDAEPIAPNPNYKRIATEEAWTTREIADAYAAFIASNPTDEPGFLALGGR